MPSRTQNRQSNRTAPAAQTSAVTVAEDGPSARALKITKLVDERRDQLMSMLQADVETFERFRAIALDAIIRDPNLLNADGLSLLQSIRHAAIMGLEPSGIMGEGAIVVYDRIAQFQPMYRGYTKLAYNSGEVAVVGADVVYESDDFEMRSGSNPEIHHVLATRDRGSAIGAYAFARLKNGELLPIWMDLAEIYKRRAVSKSWQRSAESSIWGKWPIEQMKKTPLRRLLIERVPLSYRARRALALDAAIDSIEHVETKRIPAIAGSAPGSRTRARLTAGTPPDPEPGENGAGQAGSDEADTDATDQANGAPDGSTAATDDPADVVGAAVDVCGKPGMAEGSFCIRAPQHTEPMHVDRDGQEWL